MKTRKATIKSAFLVVIAALIGSIFIAPPAQASPVYSFTNAGATGRTGPTQAQVNTAYSGTTLANAVTINTQGIQEWTVPASGNYRIEVAGAKGGGTNGGRGAIIRGDFALTQGQILRLIVGQMGVASGGHSGGGGGGSFLWLSTSTSEPMIAAGGGGGQGGAGRAGVDASSTTSGTKGTTGATADYSGAGGTNGNPGQTFDFQSNCWDAAAGAGWKGNSTTASQYCGSNQNFAYRPLNGGNGGLSFNSNGSNEGGFGGGGGGGGDAQSTQSISSVGGGGGGYSGGGNGSNDSSTNRGSGGGGGSYNSGTNTASFVGASGRNSHGYVTITSLGPSVSAFAPSKTLTNSAAITYSLDFTQSVTGLQANDFSLSGTGSSTCSVAPLGSGTSYIINVTNCSEGTVVLTLLANSIVNSSSQTGPPSNVSAATVTVDLTAPTISSVSPPSNATYIPGNNLDFTLSFSETVVVTNTPRLTLTIGSTTKYATYLSGSNSSSLIFRYSVQTEVGLFDTNGISLSSTLDQQNGYIDDLAGNRLINTTLSPPTLTSVLVAQVPSSPTIDSITVSNQTLSINFTAPASNGAAISNYKYSLNNGSTYTTRSPSSTSSPLVITGLTNGTTYQVKIRAINTAGDGAESLATSATPLDDQIAPTLSSFSTNAANGTYKIGDSITITATFSEDLRANSAIVASLSSGSSLTLTTNTASSTLSATYTVQETDETSLLDVSSFTITSAKDIAGNDLASTSLPATNISTNSTIIIDGIRPSISSSSTRLKNNYTSRVINYLITFNENIDIATLTPALTIPSGWTYSAQAINNIYTITLTNSNPQNGNIDLVIDLSQIEDLSGNTGSGSETLTLSLNRQSQVTNWIKFLWGEALEKF